MRMALAVIGWLVFGCVAFVGSMRLVNGYGPEYGIAISALCAGAAWAGHTERSARIIGWFRAALAKAGITEKEAAITMGITPPQLCHGFSGIEQLSMSRAAAVDDEGWEEFALLVLNASGKYIVLERGLVADCVLGNIAVNEALREKAEPMRPQLAFSVARGGAA